MKSYLLKSCIIIILSFPLFASANNLITIKLPNTLLNTDNTEVKIAIKKISENISKIASENIPAEFRIISEFNPYFDNVNYKIERSVDINSSINNSNDIIQHGYTYHDTEIEGSYDGVEMQYIVNVVSLEINSHIEEAIKSYKIDQNNNHTSEMSSLVIQINPSKRHEGVDIKTFCSCARKIKK